MSIILPHTTADIPFFRSNGISYQRTQQGVDLIPDHTWDEIVLPQDFVIGDSCAACQSARNTPYVCPCSAATWYNLAHNWWKGLPYTPCGDPLDPIYRTYIVSLSNLAFCPGCTPMPIAIDAPVWGGELYPYGDSNTCAWQAATAHEESDPIRISGTTISRVSCGATGVCIATGELRFDGTTRLWVFYMSSGTSTTSCNAVWVKDTGNSPDGVYSLLGCGETGPMGLVNRAVSPTGIIISHVEPT